MGWPSRLAARPASGGYTYGLKRAEILSAQANGITLLVLAAWFGFRERLGRTGFYVLFALAVTVSVQLVGLYLVFATLIVPPLASRRATRHRLAAAWMLGLAGYASGLLLSTAFDLPTGPVIVWMLVVLGLIWYTCGARIWNT